jgi:hypothetical protein
MGAEGQLGVGATLSMQEIMQRLVDRAQSDLQVGGWGWVVRGAEEKLVPLLLLPMTAVSAMYLHKLIEPASLSFTCQRL